MQKKLVHYLQCQCHSEGLCKQNRTISILSSKLLVPLQPNLVLYHSIISQSVLWKNGISAFKVKITAKVQNVNEYLSRCCFLCVSDHVHSVSPELLNRLGMVVYYHEALCPAEKLVHSLQCEGHSEGLYNHIMTIFTISFKLLVGLQTFLIW